MARVFNIYFSYNDIDHHGIVSVRKTPFFTEFTLNFDEELLAQLPGNKIISTGTGQYIFQHASQNTTPLMREILGAVSRYLQTSEV